MSKQITEADLTLKVTETARGPLNVRTITEGARTVRIMDRMGHPQPWSTSAEEWQAVNVAVYESGRMVSVQGAHDFSHALQLAGEAL